MKRYTSIIIIACAGLIWSCTKKIDLVAPTSSTDGFAFLKIVHASPGFRQVVNNRDSFNVYANGVKLNGSFLTYTSMFPTISNLYAAVPSGASTIRVTVNGVNTPDSVTLATFTKTMAAGSYYSFILTDSLLNTNESKQIFIQDKFAITDTTHFTIRFVHALLNDSTGKNVDIYSTRQATNLFSNVSPGAVSTFTSQPYYYVNDTLIVRRAGSLFELARLSTVNVPLARQRAFTLVYRGIPSVISSGVKGRNLVPYVNQ